MNNQAPIHLNVIVPAVGARLRAGARGLLIAWLTTVAASAGWAGTLSSAEEAGRRIYAEGESATGQAISAKLGFGGFDVPGSAVPCANCHGQDGLGRPEGGVVPPNIQWSELTKPYGHTHDNRRKHPAFTEKSLTKAFSFGVDPAGNDLDNTMPRYRMSEQDAANLVAYLKRIEFVLPPGVSSRGLRIGTVLPATGHFAETGKAMRNLLEAWFARINDRGGLYGRRLELVVADYGDSPDTAYINAWKLISQDDVFLLLAPFAMGWEGKLGRMAAEERIPVVAPITLLPEDSQASNLHVFHLLSGISELAQVLAVHVSENAAAKAAPFLILHAQNMGGDLVQTLVQRLGELGFAALLPPRNYVPGAAEVDALAQEIAASKPRSVLVLAPGLDLTGLARALDARGVLPYLLVPGPLAPADILELPRQWRQRVVLSYPTLPADQHAAALADYASLIGGKTALRPPHLAQAYAATLATLHALKEIGKDLNRDRFTRAFESLSGFETGMLPPLSYNSDRRIGVLGAYIVNLDSAQPGLRPSGGFIALPSPEYVAAPAAEGAK